MLLSEVGPLLDPAPLPLEMGFERSPDGVLHVACRTDMIGCTGAMFEWWFRSRPDTERYIWWHPVDHVSSEWAEGDRDTHVGSIHIVEEFFTGRPAQKLSIQFRDAGEFFAAGALSTARAQGLVSATVCGHVGFGHAPQRLESGEVLGGRLLHIGRDTARGLVLRSHFYMGQDLPGLGVSSRDITGMFTDDFGQALLMHCYNEFTFLSRFLPSIYIAARRDVLTIDLPW